MDKLYDKLLGILSSETQLHELLVEAALAFNNAIKEDNLDKIQSCTAIHDEQICQLEKLESQRTACCSSIASALKLKTIRLNTLLDHAPDSIKNELSSVHSALKSKIGELSRLTTSNRVLLENGLAFITNSVTYIQTTQKKLLPYGCGNKKSSAFQSYAMINKTV